MPTRSLETLDRLLKEYAGIRLVAAISLVFALAVLGAGIGFIFPKYEATGQLRSPDAIDLATFKRVAASYGSPQRLSAFIEGRGLQQSPAAARLLLQAKEPEFWERAATPALSFTKRDQRELGELKDAAVAAILGLDLRCDARTPAVAAEMVHILAEYYTNAVMHERTRNWIQAGLSESIGAAKSVEASIVRAELDVGLLERRVQDMKGILAKYPAAERMDTRQVVSVNPGDQSERFLSPLAQLVGFESAISQRREQIQRWKRELRQKQLLAGFFGDALAAAESSPLVVKLLPSLKELAATKFMADGSEEWAREASLRVLGQLDSFSVALGQFDLRSDSVRVTEVSLRRPSRLAVLAAGVGILCLSCVAFLRATLHADRV